MAQIDPGITSWNRLEPRPRTENFDRTLRAEIRDPLWMMTRQWQFGEFQAEDTGTALFSRVHMSTTQLNRYKLRDGGVQNIDFDLPLEAEIEKEAIHFDFLMRLEMGRHWENIICKKIKSGTALSPVATQALIDDLIGQFRKTTGPIDLNFYLPPETTDAAGFYSNPELWQATAAAAEGRGIDGAQFYEWLQIAGNVANMFVTIPVTIDIPPIITACQVEFLGWFARNYTQPANAADSAWHPSHLEYQFSCAGPRPDSTEKDVLVADEYYQGSLDWYAFDYDKLNTDFDEDANDTSLIIDEKFTVIPTAVTFAGMPNPRWWEMEDRRVDLGDVNPSTSDISKVLFAEFGLIYSNDWTIFPYTIPAGSLADVKGMVVTDCFGQRTMVQAANEGIDDDWKRWSFFGLSTKGDDPVAADTRLFLPPVVDKLQESGPLECVSFIRDEMANMVWGVEQTIPNGLGEGQDAYEAGLKYRAYLESHAIPGALTLKENDALIEYKVANTVPENWIPFIPVRLGVTPLSRQIQLQRAAMPRFVEGLTDMQRVRPRSILLQQNVTDIGETGENWGAYYIHEEEVPRSGAVVKRTWQRARAEDGTVLTWLGRRKTNGRGEGSSNLAFDRIPEKKE